MRWHRIRACADKRVTERLLLAVLKQQRYGILVYEIKRKRRKQYFFFNLNGCSVTWKFGTYDMFHVEMWGMHDRIKLARRR
jgi:hypothetical protein